MKKAVKKIAITDVALAAGILGITRYAFNQTFERKQLKSLPIRRRKNITKEQNEEYERQVQEGQKWLHSMSLQNITIRSFDGLWLVGHYLKAPDEERTIIMCHGWRGHWDREFALSVKWFYENKCSLLLVEQRAHGQSEGRYMTFGIYERKDMQLWIKWLNSRPNTHKIYLYGCSMGAATVLMTSAETGRVDHVYGIIADCGYSSPYDIIKMTMQATAPLPEHPFMDILRIMFRIRTGISLKSFSPEEAMKKTSLPILFIHGTSDTFVPAKMSMRNYSAGDKKNMLLFVKNADHCRSFFIDPKAYKRAVMEFFHTQEMN